jgi:prepilin-type N-terminal cleavage/methylation domain-containing protein
VRRTARSGFTLLELVVTIAVTGVVALLVYGVLDTAIDTERRVVARGEAARASAGWQSLVAAAIRNARPADAGGDAAFLLENGRSDGGLSSDRLTFFTAGGVAPLTSDVEWQVTLGAGRDGVVLAARPVGVAAPDRRIRAPGGLRGVSIRVRGDAPGDPWRDTWPRAGELPRAVEVTFEDGDGDAAGSLRVALPR